MRPIPAALVIAACIAAPAAGLAQSAPPDPSRESRGDTPAPDTLHATQGVVKSIDDTTLVVSRPHDRGDITFVLSTATHRAGTIAVGSTVSVRYRDEGKSHLATAIALQRR